MLPQSSWCVHCSCGQSVFAVDQFNSRQPSGLNKFVIDREMFSRSVDACFVLALPFQHRDLEPEFV